MQEKVELKTLNFWYNITMHHYKKQYFSSFLAKNQKTGRDQIYFFDFFTSGDIYRSNSKQIFGVPCHDPWRLIFRPVPSNKVTNIPVKLRLRGRKEIP